MKKLLGILALLVFATNQAFSLGVEVQPTFKSRSNEQDRIWVGSFQLVWNDFMNKVVHGPIRFREGTPVMVQELNRQSFNVSQLDDSSYYKITTKVKKNTKKQIEKGIKKKFNETSDLLSKMDLEPRNDKFIIYAMLKKEFEFEKPFDKLEKSLFAGEYATEYFGINKYSDNSLRNNVKILYYNSAEDFAIMLKTNKNEEVYLYKNSSNKPFMDLWSDMFKKELTFKGETYFRNADELKVPNISLNIDKKYEELAKKRVMGTNLVIEQAMQTIKFGMNNKGVELKSEAGLSFATCSLPHPDDLIPRYFYLDDTFVIFLKEKDKRLPYMALRVNDIRNFQ